MLRYLKNSQDLGLSFKGKGAADFIITGFLDASFATGSKGKSVDGFIVYVNGMPVCIRSGQQSTVALSTRESEYIATVGCAKKKNLHQDYEGGIRFQGDADEIVL